jgi:hypothetical protein
MLQDVLTELKMVSCYGERKEGKKCIKEVKRK